MVTPPSHKTSSYCILENVANKLKLCANGVNVVATVYDLFKNFMDGLGREGCSRTLSLLKKFGRIGNKVHVELVKNGFKLTTKGLGLLGNRKFT